jgi:nucleoid-associated protein YgaU
MPVFSTSRYAQNRIKRVPDSQGVFRATILHSYPEEVRFQYTEYIVVAGDRIDQIAYRFLGDPSYWWLIADANPEVTDWNNIAVNTTLRIPRVS